MTGVAVPLGRLQYIDPVTDEPLAFGTLEHYVPGSLTQKATWSDNSQQFPNPNPITLDAAGQAAVWGSGLYRQILKRQDGSLVWDLVTGFLDTGGGGGGGGSGDVMGPGAANVGNFAIFGNTIGTQIVDGGTPGTLAFQSVAPIANGGTGATTAPNARTTLGLAIGTNVQAYNVNLAAIAGLTSAANKGFYFTGSGTAATFDLTSFARTLLDDTDGPSMRATIGAEAATLLNGINTQTASYTLVLGDAGQLVEMNAAGANNLTIPANASVPFPLKTRIDVMQIGAGQTTFVPDAGVTIRSSGGKTKLSGQYSGAGLYKRGTDEWVLYGDITT